MAPQTLSQAMLPAVANAVAPQALFRAKLSVEVNVVAPDPVLWQDPVPCQAIF